MKAHSTTPIWSGVQLAAVFSLGLGVSGPAHAVDGCRLLLCMAGNWQSISECVPTVRQALRDVARGRGWPTCSLAGDSAAGNQYVAAQQCPQQYVTYGGTDWNGQAIYSCPFGGVIHIVVEGQPWSRTWWSPSGDAVIEWLPAARVAFAGLPDAMDERFDRERAAWVTSEQARCAAEAAAAAQAPQGGGG